MPGTAGVADRSDSIGHYYLHLAKIDTDERSHSSVCALLSVLWLLMLLWQLVGIRRQVGEVCGLADVDAVFARGDGQVFRCKHEPPLAAGALLAVFERVVCQVGDKLVRGERGNSGDARIGALVAGEAHEIFGDRVGHLHSELKREDV